MAGDSDLEVLIQKLLALLDDSSLNSEKECKHVVEHIRTFFKVTRNKSELDVLFSILFRSNNSLLYFIEKGVRNKSIKAGVRECLSLVLYIIGKFSSLLTNHILAIKDASYKCVQEYNVSADVKEKAYDVIIAIVKSKVALQKTSELNIPALVSFLYTRELVSKKTLSPNVVMKVYELYGAIAEHFQEYCHDTIPALLRNICCELKAQTFHAHSVKYPIITGCLLALKGVLVNFTQGWQEEQEMSKEIYGYLKNVCIYNDTLSRHVFQRVGLDVFSRHIAQFWGWVREDFRFWLRELADWASKHSPENHKAGQTALRALHQHSWHVITDLDDTSANKQAIAQILLQHYKDTFMDSLSAAYKVEIAIEGVGALAFSLNYIRGGHETGASFFKILLQRAQAGFIQDEGREVDSNSHLLPMYLESLSKICRAFKFVRSDHLTALQQLAKLVIENYPYQLQYVKDQAENRICRTIVNMSFCDQQTLDGFLYPVVHQGIIVSCGHSLVEDAELEKELTGREVVVTYKDFLDLWTKIIKKLSTENKVTSELTPEKRNNISEKFYDCLIKTFSDILEKLNVEYQKEESEELEIKSDPSSTLKGTRPQDHNILCNLSNLYKDLFRELKGDILARWLPDLITTVVNRSMRVPLVSAFYKLLSAILNLADVAGFFLDESNDIQSLGRFVVRYLEDVMVHCKQYKDDLQASCLLAIIAVPVPLISPLLEGISPSLAMLFQLGQNNLPLAHNGMDALERWQNALPVDQLRPILQQILPTFDPFLSSKGISTEVSEEEEPKMSKRQELRAKRVAESSQLAELQQRMLRLLSQQDSVTLLSLLRPNHCAAAAWTQDPLLTLKVPFPDRRINVSLDSMLPRIVELALNSSDRQTKTSACEVFHACVIIFTGTGLTLMQTVEKKLAYLLRRLMPPLLRLGCGSDQVGRQLFQPLALQLMRWLSTPRMAVCHTQTSMALEAVWDGITDDTDTALRDFSASCLLEFIQWSIKHSASDGDLVNNENVKAVLRQIRIYCIHPNLSKRIGSAIAFSHLAGVLREHKPLVDQYWLEMIYYLVRNLALGGDVKDHPAIVALKDSNVIKVIRKHEDLLNQVSADRRLPAGLKSAVLRELLRWLLHQCGSKTAICAEKCRDLAMKLVEFVPGLSGLSELVNEQEMIMVCEGGGSGEAGESKLPIQPTMADGTRLLACLDCYSWCLAKGLISPNVVTQIPRRVIPCVEYFINVVEIRESLPALSSRDGYAQIRTKCQVIIELFNFLSLLDSAINNLPYTFWNPKFWQLVALCLFSPEKIGFDWRNTEEKEKLMLKLRSLFNTLRNHRSSLEDLYCFINDCIDYDCNMTTKRLSLMFEGNLQMTVEYRQFIDGLETLHRTELLKNVLHGNTWNGTILLREVSSCLIDKDGIALHTEPSVISYANQLVSFADLLGAEVANSLSCVLNNDIVLDPRSPTDPQTTRGRHFLSVCEQPLLAILLKDPRLTITTLTAQLCTSYVDLVLKLLNLCRYSRVKQHRASPELVNAVFFNWTKFLEWAERDVTRRPLLLEILRAVVTTFPPSSAVGCLNRQGSAVASWLFHQISNPSVQLTNKVDLIDLLQFVVVPDSTDHMLLSAMSSLEAEFPVLTSELRTGSVERNTFIAVYKAILRTLVSTGSIIVLRTVANAAIDGDHVCADYINIAIKDFMKRHSREKQMEALKVMFDVFANESKTPDLRLGTVDMFLIPMIGEALKETVILFFAEKIQWIIDSVEEKIKNSNQEKKNEKLVVVKTGCLKLTETLFNRLDKSELESADNIIVKNAVRLPKPDKNLPQNLISLSVDVRKIQNPFSNDNQKELFRKMQCANQNIIMTFMCNSKQMEKIASFYIFGEDKDPIWATLIKTEPRFTFPIEFDDYPKMKKRLVQIRSIPRPESGTSQNGGPVVYMPSRSQTLFTSSLEEDITRFDFSMYNVREDRTVPLGVTEGPVNVGLVMEMDILNEHECMASFCKVVEHLSESFPRVSDEQVSQLPFWMGHLKKSLTASNQPSNCRAFIVKLIIECKNYFKPFARNWIGPILQTVVDKCFGEGLNYLIHDIVVMFSEWQTKAVPDSSAKDQLLASEFLRLLVLYTPNERTGVFKYNVETVKCVLTMWKSFMAVPYQELMDLITPQAVNSKITEPGILLAEAFLANDILPFNDTGKLTYYEHLLTNLQNTRRDIYKQTAFIMGKILQIVSNGKPLTGDDLDFQNKIIDVLNNNYATTGSNNKLAEFVESLYNVQINYPPIVKGFETKCVAKVQSRLHALQTMLMKILITALDFDFHSDAFTMLHTQLPVFLNDRSDPDMQLCSLKFVNKLLPYLSPPQVMELLPSIVILQHHIMAGTRSAVYDILARIYDDYLEKRDETAQDVWKQVRKVLTSGLTDPDEKLQTKLYEFWTTNNRLPPESMSRLADIVGQLYSPECEQDFLPLVLNLLLQSCELTNEYNENIFPSALAPCAFQKYHVSGSWRLQHAAMVPMFANTLASQMEFASLSSYTDAPQLRATQSVMSGYSPSLLVSVPSKAEEEVSLYSFGGGSVGGSSFLSRSFRQGSDFGTTLLSPIDSAGGSQSPNAQQLRPMRFLRNQQRLSRAMAMRNIVKGERQVKQQAERMKRKEGEVRLTRDYRTGELPDIEIQFSGVIKAFQTLAKKDHVIARQLLVVVYKGLVTAGVSDMADQRLAGALDMILQSSTRHEPSLMATVLEMSLVRPELCHADGSSITEVSKNSRQMSVGALLVEAKLLSQRDVPPPLKRSRSMAQSHDPDNWVHLAEIYHSMEEKDVVQGLFEDKIAESCAQSVKEALQSEGLGHWKAALIKYKQALGGSADNFLYEACFNCLAHLANWRELNKTLKNNLLDNDLDEVWSDNWSRDHVLPWLFLSEIHCARQISVLSLSEDFKSALSRWIKIPSGSQHIKSRLGEYLSVVWLINDEVERAKLTSDDSLSEFLSQWQLLDPLSDNLRIRHLLDLYPLLDIHNFLSLLQSHPNDMETVVMHSVDQWMNSSPSVCDDLLAWQTRTAYRNIFSAKLESQIDDPDLKTRLDYSQIMTQLNVVQCALDKKDAHIAHRFVENLRSEMKSKPGVVANAQHMWAVSNSRYVLLRAQLEPDNDSGKLEKMLGAWNKIDLLSVSELAQSQRLTLQFHKADIYSALLTLVREAPSSVGGLSEEKKSEFRKHIDLEGDIISQLKSKVVSTLQEAVGIGSSDVMAEPYLRIARFCHQLEDPEYEDRLVESLLRAMQYGSAEARRLFPCLLQLPLITHEQLFTDESRKVPEWMFLSWVSQLLANLDTEIGVVLAPLLERLAIAYPVALQYPFHLSRDLYTYKYPATRHMVNKLKPLLTFDPSTADLLRALGCVCQPLSCFTYHLDRLRVAIAQDWDAFDKAYLDMKSEAYPSDDTKKIKGRAFKDVESYSVKLEQLLSQWKSEEISGESFVKEIELLKAEIHRDGESKKMSQRRMARNQLASFSPWLAESYCGDVELPGQYTGERRPLPQHHVTIAGFKPVVKSFQSLRAPIKITVVGNDAKEHSFLVKFGEDLRQDQRIQQMFTLMNQLLRDNITTSRRKLSVDTYSVVPLNARLGIIKWVDQTEVLSRFIFYNEELIGKGQQALNMYKEYFNKCFENKEEFYKAPREESIRLYRKVLNEIPMFALRDAVWRLSVSPEAFMRLRAEMLTSHACLSACHWLLGIGDRHLDNTLVCQSTGRVVGIDFGHAFGTATRCLSIPELMPMRLTPQILNLAAPFKESGLIKESMVHTLQVLREHRRLLMATMTVFILEPSLDWQKFAQKLSDNEAVVGSTESNFSRERIALAQHKLEGIHPRLVTERELASGLGDRAHYPALLALLRDTRDCPGIRDMPDKNLSARQQVECLIAQATNEHILSKAFRGFSSWV